MVDIESAKPRKVGRGMGRKSVTENFTAQKYLQPQDAIWAAIRALKQFTRSDVSVQLVNDNIEGINDHTINSYVQRLARGGYLSIEKRTAYHGAAAQLFVYTLTRDCGNEAPRLRKDGSPSQHGGANDRLWRAMKILKTFTYRDLIESASIEGGEIPATTVKSYIKHLHAAGYLAVTKPGAPNTPAHYRWLSSKNTGPRAPMILRTHQVFDPNLQQIVWREQL